jgi:hypothetical protein
MYKASFLAKYLRSENDSWIPRVPSFPFPPRGLKGVNQSLNARQSIAQKYMQNPKCKIYENLMSGGS